MLEQRYSLLILWGNNISIIIMGTWQSIAKFLSFFCQVFILNLLVSIILNCVNNRQPNLWYMLCHLIMVSLTILIFTRYLCRFTSFHFSFLSTLQSAGKSTFTVEVFLYLSFKIMLSKTSQIGMPLPSCLRPGSFALILIGGKIHFFHTSQKIR